LVSERHIASQVFEAPERPAAAEEVDQDRPAVGVVGFVDADPQIRSGARDDALGHRGHRPGVA